MRRFAASLALALAAGAAAQLPRPPARGELTRAIHADAALWLLDDNGFLRQLPDKADNPVPVALKGRAVDLCRIGGTPIIAVRDGDRITVQRRTGDGWRTIGNVPLAAAERVVGLSCNGSAPVLLTDKHVTVLGRVTQPLDGALPRGFRQVLFRDGGSLLVGSNAGEWGGGLVRIALATGVVTPIEDAGAPVQDIAAEPGKPGCVVIAVGLVHFIPSGQLTELCGNTARRLFTAPYSTGLGLPDKPGVRSYASVAFFALATGKSALTAIGIDGLRRIGPDGIGAPRPLPPPTERGGEYIAEVSPDYWLVMSGINARGSVGGAMPLVVPR